MKGFTGYIGLKNVSGTKLNPATEEKQDEIIAAINAISGLQRSTDIEGLGKSSIGTTAAELVFTGTPEAIIISADAENLGILYIGKSNVTSAGANALIDLSAGEAVTMNYDDSTNAVYVVASQTSQNFIAGALL